MDEVCHAVERTLGISNPELQAAILDRRMNYFFGSLFSEENNSNSRISVGLLAAIHQGSGTPFRYTKFGVFAGGFL